MTSKYIALDTEMYESCGKSCVGRVSIVDKDCKILYDTYVKPTGSVSDLRTQYSGLTTNQLNNGKNFQSVQSEVRRLIENKVLVGHDLDHDLKALGIAHSDVRDTAKYQPFKNLNNGNKPSLKLLAKEKLNKNIHHNGPHDSVEDAKIAMEIFFTEKKWV